MIVSMLQVIIELPEIESIKDKRRIVKSLKDKLIRRYRISVAEVDLQESLGFTQLGAAVVSNSRVHGEKIMQKTMHFIEEECMGRIQDVQIVSERF
ncbi:MAG: DUF503 domain-containing protein [Spirochaetaceae bacterium]|nr:MAG: DUF503 domain-containing protein [Spirochaetaceae bacterium]